MGRIGVLTGGGDVPGLNTVIKTLALRCAEDGHEAIGLRKGWRGITEVDPDDPESRAALVLPLTPTAVRTVDRTGGTFLHSSRFLPSRVRERDTSVGIDLSAFPADAEGKRDLTPRVLENLRRLSIDSLVVTGGDDTLGFAAALHQAGFPTVGIPKTMDNDVMGTEYCLGFSTAVTRSVDMVTDLRTPTGSHERIAVIELFGRNSGATALYTGHLSGADRVLIAEVPFDMDRVSDMIVADQDASPSHYAVLLLSEGAHPIGGAPRVTGEPDAYGHRKLGGVGAWVKAEIESRTGRQTLYQQLAYLMRSGRPDSLDSMVATNFANLAYDLLAAERYGHMTALCRGVYCATPLSVVQDGARPLHVDSVYDSVEYRPRIRLTEGLPMFLGEPG